MVRILIFALIFTAAFHSFASAQHDHTKGTTNSANAAPLGKINFPTSATPEAQRKFIEGVLLLHSFEYDRAKRAFEEAAKIEPNFALAYWGEAMTYDHRIWDEQDQKAALAVLGRLGATPAERRAKAPTLREKMYLDAVEKLFQDGTEAEVASKYSEAMGAIVKRFPDDLEAQAFYALSILGLTGTVRNTENYMRAAAIAEEIYRKNPDHPGALHYLIHAYDDPVHAPLGLRAARAYGTVARGASHAQHMPSHIFFALGMWDDSIKANIASMKTARDGGSGGYHALHWLMHSYLQVGQVDEAAKLLAIIENDAKTTTSPYNRLHLALCRATMLVETEGKGPASMMTPVDSSGIADSRAFAGHDLAIGLEFVRRNDLAGARKMLEQLRARAHAAPSAGNRTERVDRYTTPTKPGMDTLGVMAAIMDASIRSAAGERDEAIRMITAAGEAEDDIVFEYGPPAIVKPAWEAAGEMLLKAGRKKEAADAFRRALKRYPNRRLSNQGLSAATK